MLRILLYHLFVLQVPVIQIANSRADVSGEAQPAKIWGHAPPSDTVDRPPEVGQIGISAEESDDVNGGFDWSLGDEEERHPGQVQAKLDSVQGCALLGHSDLVDGREWRVNSGIDRAVGSVAHESIVGLLVGPLGRG